MKIVQLIISIYKMNSGAFSKKRAEGALQKDIKKFWMMHMVNLNVQNVLHV